MAGAIRGRSIVSATPSGLTSSCVAGCSWGQLGLFEQDVTLSEFVEEWWRVHVIPNLAGSTRESYRHTWAKHVRPKLGGHRVGELSPKVVARYRAELLAEGRRRGDRPSRARRVAVGSDDGGDRGADREQPGGEG